jgi:hypothetical protein
MCTTLDQKSTIGNYRSNYIFFPGAVMIEQAVHVPAFTQQCSLLLHTVGSGALSKQYVCHMSQATIILTAEALSSDDDESMPMTCNCFGLRSITTNMSMPCPAQLSDCHTLPLPSLATIVPVINLAHTFEEWITSPQTLCPTRRTHEHVTHGALAGVADHLPLPLRIAFSAPNQDSGSAAWACTRPVIQRLPKPVVAHTTTEHAA